MTNEIRKTAEECSVGIKRRSIEKGGMVRHAEQYGKQDGIRRWMFSLTWHRRDCW